jgi:Cu(I)/Ag(I) efflux system membrane fusion protein
VIAAKEAGAFDVVNVTTGAEANGKTAILSGLKGDESVVLSGQFLIDSEANLRSAVSRMSAAGEAPKPSESGQDAAPERTPSHLTKGRVTAIEEESITIAHEPVPSLRWPSMTMGFRKPPSGLPQGMRVRDEVSFSFRDAGGGNFQIEALTILKAGERPPDEPAHSPEQRQ